MSFSASDEVPLRVHAVKLILMALNSKVVKEDSRNSFSKAFWKSKETFFGDVTVTVFKYVL